MAIGSDSSSRAESPVMRIEIETEVDVEEGSSFTVKKVLVAIGLVVDRR